MSKATVSMLAAIMLLSVASAPALAQAAQAQAGVLRAAIFGEPSNLDFMYEHDMMSTIVDWNIYDQLARWDYKTGTLQPELATSWKQETPTTWLVTLRHGVQFQDGYGEMTAADVAFSVNYILQNHADIAFLYGGVEKAEVVSKYVVRYVLSKPNTAFVETSIQGFGGMVLSKKAFEKEGKDQFARHPVGAGPFEVQDWVAGDHITLVPNPDYWDRSAVKLKKVVITFVPDPTVEENLLKTGAVDFIQNVQYQDVKSLEATPGLKVVYTPGWNWNYISFGTVDGPFGNKLVRQAVAYAIDRQQIANEVYYGLAIPAYTPLPPGFMFSDQKIATSMYGPTANVAKAKQLLTEAGYPNGLKATAVAPAKADVRRELLIVAQQLKAAGIDLQVKFMDNASYAQIQRKPGDYVDFNQITIMSPDPDSAIFWFWHTGGSLTRNYSNPTIDALINQGETQVDPTQREATYHKLQSDMLDQAWYIYTVHRDLVRAMSNRVTGYEVTPQDMAAIWFKYTNVAGPK